MWCKVRLRLTFADGSPANGSPAWGRDWTDVGGPASGWGDAFLIVVPSTLIHQWEKECQIFLKESAWEILVYPSSEKDRKAWWQNVYPVSKEGAHRIIIAGHPVSEVRLRLTFVH